MKLYVMRHGPAEDGAASGLDGDRALTPSGRERVRLVAKVLLDAEETPMRIVTSPLVRAVQTAEIVAITGEIGVRGGTVEVRREVAPGGDGAKLLERLALERAKRVMLVGHEPDLSALVNGLLGEFSRPFEKAMVVGIHVPDGTRGSTGHRLRFIVDPKSVELVSGDPADR